MAKTQKAKTGGVRNDSRKNGKASKREGAARGSKGTKLTESQKVLLGGGMLVKWDKANKSETIAAKARARKARPSVEVFDK